MIHGNCLKLVMLDNINTSFDFWNRQHDEFTLFVHLLNARASNLHVRRNFKWMVEAFEIKRGEFLRGQYVDEAEPFLSSYLNLFVPQPPNSASNNDSLPCYEPPGERKGGSGVRREWNRLRSPSTHRWHFPVVFAPRCRQQFALLLPLMLWNGMVEFPWCRALPGGSGLNSWAFFFL